MRIDKRKVNQLRSIRFKRNYLRYAMGSCLVEMGNTRVLCTASIQETVPPFLRNKGKGWLTAEYGMLPASCNERISRESSKGKPSGRTQEIQRLIGRSLRSILDMTKLGERTVWIDADVIQGDGGTRTASITGAYIALYDAVQKLIKEGKLQESPIVDAIAAVSVGMVEGSALLDLCYHEDSKAEVDMNVVMTGSGKFIEVQGTAEGKPFSGKEMDSLLTLAQKGIQELITAQRKCLKLSKSGTK